MKFLIPLIAALILGGCMEREIYSEITDPSRIGYPPSSVQVIDLSGNLKTDLKTDSDSTTKIEVYVHRAACSSASAKALGSDFDGYVRITIFENGRTIARAQMDYKGEPSPAMIQMIHDTLIEKLQWSKQ
ncbi:MAG: hypothetical protein PHV10_08370 [Sulfuricurvum sp.]|nr:hypothetical protein [Sulfuricurvum sp.]